VDKNQLIRTIRKINTKKMSRESAAMIDSMNKTKLRVESVKTKAAKANSITISTGI